MSTARSELDDDAGARRLHEHSIVFIRSVQIQSGCGGPIPSVNRLHPAFSLG